MNVMDELLQRFNLKYEDLTSAERDQLHLWMEDLSKNELTIPKIRTYVAAMRDAVEIELTKAGHESKQDLLLKARLRNYMLLEAFLTSPEKAKQAIERSLSGIHVGKKVK
jgi:hypothetical protein